MNLNLKEYKRRIYFKNPKTNKNILRLGNMKLGYDTLIFNIGSATDCINRLNGNCQLKNPSDCYAFKAEKFRPNIKPYRDNQLKYWDNTTVNDFFNLIKDIKQKWDKRPDYPNITYLRFNESGDIRNKKDLNKIIKLSNKLKTIGIKVYMYSASKHLNLNHNSDNLVISGSGFNVDNTYKIVDKLDKNKPYCKNNCRICNLCKNNKGLIIQQLKH